MMNCKGATKLSSDALDRKLSLKERIAVKTHTMMCSGCRNFDRQMADIRNLSKTYIHNQQVTHEDKPSTDKSLM